jgi:diphthine-ammonia ligase
VEFGITSYFFFLPYSTEVETVVHADNDFATVAFLRIKNASLDSKDVHYLEDVQVPSLLDNDLLSVRDAVLRSQESTSSIVVLADPVPNSVFDIPNSSSRRLDSWVAVANVHRELKESLSEVTIEDEVKECFQKLQGTFLLELLYTA